MEYHCKYTFIDCWWHWNDHDEMKFDKLMRVHIFELYSTPWMKKQESSAQFDEKIFIHVQYNCNNHKFFFFVNYLLVTWNINWELNRYEKKYKFEMFENSMIFHFTPCYNCQNELTAKFLWTQIFPNLVLRCFSFSFSRLVKTLDWRCQKNKWKVSYGSFITMKDRKK